MGWREAISSTVGGLGFELVEVERAQRGLLRVTIDRIPGRAYTVPGVFILVEDWGRYRVLGSTLDDAAGEAFDKVGQLLGLPYPGGPAIDAIARSGNPHAFAFPRALRKRDGCDVSFSGVKTAVRLTVEKLGAAEAQRQVADLAASFQEAVVASLEDKFTWALRHAGVRHAVLAGGVAANSLLRERLSARAAAEGDASPHADAFVYR